MCGIFGITKTTKFNQSNVSGATLLCRRGPDNEGDWQNGYIKLKKLNFKYLILIDQIINVLDAIKLNSNSFQFLLD